MDGWRRESPEEDLRPGDLYCHPPLDDVSCGALLAFDRNYPDSLRDSMVLHHRRCRDVSLSRDLDPLLLGRVLLGSGVSPSE